MSSESGVRVCILYSLDGTPGRRSEPGRQQAVDWTMTQIETLGERFVFVGFGMSRAIVPDQPDKELHERTAKRRARKKGPRIRLG